jgi:hypothetical protein
MKEIHPQKPISNFDFSNGYALCSHKLGDCFVHLFKGGSPRVVARFKGAQPLARRFFVSFLCAYAVKESG